jgi:hypothetical protein
MKTTGGWNNLTISTGRTCGLEMGMLLSVDHRFLPFVVDFPFVVDVPVKRVAARSCFYL